MDKRSTKLPPPAKPRVAATASGMSGVSKNPNLQNGYLAMYRSISLRETENRLRRRQGSKEIVRRALMPPMAQKPSLRWRNFRPTPTRFSSVMSVD